MEAGGCTVNKEKIINEEFTEDPRYKQAEKEAKIGIALFLLNFGWWFAFAYGLGSKPVEDYTYIFGFPSWFFFSAILGYPVFAILTIIMVKKFFKDMPLEPESESESESRPESESEEEEERT